MVRHLLRAAGGSSVLVVCLMSLPGPASQTGGLGSRAGTGNLNDPFTFYYAFYLPNQQLQALRPTPMDSINSAMVTRQYYAQNERRNLYNPISPYSDQKTIRSIPIPANKATSGSQDLIGSRTTRPTQTAGALTLLRPRRPVLSRPSRRAGQNANVYTKGARQPASQAVERGGGVAWAGGMGGWHGWRNGRHGRHGWHDVTRPSSSGRDRFDRSSSASQTGNIDVASRPDQLRLTPDERADLVAYVDGELPESHARTIATKLTKSATARREVEMLQKTWELLDYLPRPQVTEQFSEKTVSHIRRLELEGHPWEPVLVAWSARLGRLAVYLVDRRVPRWDLAMSSPAGPGRTRPHDWFAT